MSSHQQVDCIAEIYSTEDVHIGGVSDYMYVITNKASTSASFHFRRNGIMALRHTTLYSSSKNLK